MQREEMEKNERHNSLFFNAHSFTHIYYGAHTHRGLASFQSVGCSVRQCRSSVEYSKEVYVSFSDSSMRDQEVNVATGYLYLLWLIFVFTKISVCRFICSSFCSFFQSSTVFFIFLFADTTRARLLSTVTVISLYHFAQKTTNQLLVLDQNITTLQVCSVSAVLCKTENSDFVTSWL